METRRLPALMEMILTRPSELTGARLDVLELTQNGEAQVEVDGGGAEEDRVEAVEEASAAGQQAARVLDADLALRHRLGQVPDGGQEAADRSHREPVDRIEALQQKGEEQSAGERRQETADPTFPGLRWRDRWSHLVLAEPGTCEVAADVVQRSDQDV